jgi:hypothetical protein
VGWVAVLALAAFIALVMHSVQASNNRLADGQKAQATVITRLSSSLDTTRQQLQQHGVTPSAPPAQSIVKAVPGLPGAVGAPGAQGAQGAPGSTGPPGVPGSAGSPGPTGSPGPVSTVPGPGGSPGVAGPQGVPGVAGADGKDGAPGKDGTNGTDGRDGANGAPPAGWTWTDPAGISYTCSPVDGFDPTAPRYTCAPDPVTPPTESPSRKGLLGVLALGSLSAYRRLA